MRVVVLQPLIRQPPQGAIPPRRGVAVGAAVASRAALLSPCFPAGLREGLFKPASEHRFINGAAKWFGAGMGSGRGQRRGGVVVGGRDGWDGEGTLRQSRGMAMHAATIRRQASPAEQHHAAMGQAER